VIQTGSDHSSQSLAHQFRVLGRDFDMQHLGAENEMTKILCDLWDAMTDEERERALPKEQRLKGLTPEERLKGLPAKERVKGLSVEERLEGLTPEDWERLRQWLQQPPAEGNPDKP
jgi:hypothetical protein